jgi:glycosidase
MNYIFRKAVMKFLFDENPISVQEFCDRVRAAFPDGRGDIPMNLLGSHDTTRLLSQPCASLERIKLAYALLFFMPGASCIYYGEELSMKGGKDPDCRRSVPWDELENRRSQPLYEFICNLVKMRRENPVLRDGSLSIANTADGFTVTRTLGKKTMTLSATISGAQPSFEIK